MKSVLNLKYIRRAISTLFFVLTVLSVWPFLSRAVSNQILAFQFGPAIIKLTGGWAGLTFVFIVIFIFIVVGLGRIYCSTICPLGFLQDIAIWLGKILQIKKDWTIIHNKQLKLIRAGILGITAILLTFGSAFAAGLFEPFAFFSRLMFFLKMLFQGTLIGTTSAILFILISSFIVLLLAVKRGRFFCSWLCPAGTILWGLSSISMFKFRIKQLPCNQCGSCLTECKAGAISVIDKRIDQALCVGCFNCVSVCRTDAIKIAPEISKPKSEDRFPEINTARRKFLAQFGSLALIAAIPANVFAGSQNISAFSEEDKLYCVFPLGSSNLYRFKRNCTGCMLCASNCPSKIIRLSTEPYGNSPILPVLNFKNNYCLEDCVSCSQACTTGALEEILQENKKTTKMASLELILNECLIVSEGLECTICAEICPLNAIEMKQGADMNSPVPVVIQEKCNGCGKCQFRCPAKKKERIFRFHL